jgi:hypothetical protein
MTDLEYIPRQRIAFKNGDIQDGFNPSIQDVKSLVRREEDMLHWTLKRLKSPHTMKVSLSGDVFDLRKRLVFNNQLMDR